MQPSEQKFILIGGFLGAGKTSCLIQFARWLSDRGLRAGIITNDQGQGLIDTASAQKTLNEVRQITGGCFCCRSDDLIAAIKDLDETVRPNVFLAEPVGSCTDLVATVLLPLEKVYFTKFRKAPMSVVLDAKRALNSYFGRARMADGFSKDVRYIYRKQLEEAEILVLNKTDLLSGRQIEKLGSRLKKDFPKKDVVIASCKSGLGLEQWFERLMAIESNPDCILQIDYARYGRGEAKLGWYNATLDMSSDKVSFDPNIFLLELAQLIQRDLEERRIQVAHFKMSLRPHGNHSDLSVVNVVRNGDPPTLSSQFQGLFDSGVMLINLRAEGDPDALAQIVNKHLQNLPFSFVEQSAFRPGMPKPVHRVAALL